MITSSIKKEIKTLSLIISTDIQIEFFAYTLYTSDASGLVG